MARVANTGIFSGTQLLHVVICRLNLPERDDAKMRIIIRSQRFTWSHDLASSFPPSPSVIQLSLDFYGLRKQSLESILCIIGGNDRDSATTRCRMEEFDRWENARQRQRRRKTFRRTTVAAVRHKAHAYACAEYVNLFRADCSIVERKCETKVCARGIEKFVR